MKFFAVCALVVASFMAIDGSVVRLASGVVRDTASKAFSLGCTGGQCRVPSVEASVKQFAGTIGRKILDTRCKPGAGPQLDFLIVIDGSGSVPRSDFEAAKQDAKQYARDLYDVFSGLGGFSARAARVALMVFSNVEDIKIYLDFTTYNLAAINRAIDSVRYPGHSTYTTRALERAISLFEEKGRRSADKILLIFTDGKSNGYYGANRNMPKPRVPAATLKNELHLGVKIYGWPIGRLTEESLAEIRSIVSSPADNYINYAKDYAEARQIARQGFQVIKDAVRAKGSACLDGGPVLVQPKPLPDFGIGDPRPRPVGGRGILDRIRGVEFGPAVPV